MRSIRVSQEVFALLKKLRLVRLVRKRKKRVTTPRRESLYLKHKEVARKIVHNRIAHFAPVYGLTVGRVAIRDQKSRWGSCSRKGNLNFNYRIALLPSHLVDYIVVHELCHLKEFNHSEHFWNHVARTIPDYLACRKELHQISLRTIS